MIFNQLKITGKIIMSSLIFSPKTIIICIEWQYLKEIG